MVYPNANAGGRGLPWRLKWMYEFWGFAINGINSATIPGGFASNNGITMPTNFTGGTSLLTSGSDGSHSAVGGELFSGDCVFTATASTPFTTSMANKAMVIWVPGSNSSEDSIYLISRVISSTQVVLNINTGGTPDPTTKHPIMSARTGVYYRVVDMEAGSNSLNNTTFGNNLVFDVRGSLINPGQGNVDGYSQLQISTSVANNSFFNGTPAWVDAMISTSGSGSWDGYQVPIINVTNANPTVVTTAFPHGIVSGQTITITGVAGQYYANGTYIANVLSATTFNMLSPYQVSTIGNYTGGGIVTRGFANDGYQSTQNIAFFGGAAYSSGQTCVNMIGDQTFLITHMREQDLFQTNGRINIYFEVPKRLYPMGNDLNPLAYMLDGFSSLITSSTTASYGGGWNMRGYQSDGGTNLTNASAGTRGYRTLVKAMRGDGTPDVFGQNLSNYLIGYNTIEGTIPQSDGILCLPGINNQFSLARVKLRSCKFTGTHVPAYHRIGLNGEFIQIQNGICWPWDGVIQPQQLLFYGSG